MMAFQPIFDAIYLKLHQKILKSGFSGGFFA